MSPARPRTRYSIVPVDPAAHLFEVRCTLDDLSAKTQAFELPAWIPGSYMIRDFARHIVSWRAENEHGPVAWRKRDKQTWECDCGSGRELTITYRVYAWDLSVRAAHLDDTHAYFNGTSVFVCPIGRECDPVEVDIRPPQGDAYRDWRVATSLPERSAPRYGFGLYQAANYAELIDHPVEMGTFTLASFEAGGISHDIAITGQHRADMERLQTDLTKICAHHIGMFRTPGLLHRYVFLVMAVGDGYGGLEHRASTSLMCSRDELPRAGVTAVDVGYQRFLGLCSHEYFHTWNVKRIQPEVFQRNGLRQEVHTETLWAFEGITSYYDDLALLRCGLVSTEQYFKVLGETVSRVWRGGGRFHQSIAESSFDAWTRLYKMDENAPNAIVSYYSKGSLLALALDLTLRRDSDIDLDEIMRGLWESYGHSGRGVPEGAIQSFVEEHSGLDLRDFFSRYLYGTEDIPLVTLLADFGVDLSFCTEPGADSGKAQPPGPSLGAKVESANGEARLANVYEGEAAHRAGLSAGDVLIALDGLRVNVDSLSKRLARYAPGETLTVHAFRRDELQQRQLTLDPSPATNAILSLQTDPGSEQARRRQAWLGV
ncbi:MAG: M61 family metallopeptidase [Chromatiales bacterium]|nr:M61 family metallopeptidase [Chromatiales bacterium]